MNLGFIAHVIGGALAIAAGAATIIATKGGSSHRRFGLIFSLSLLFAALLAIYLALFTVPTTIRTAPPPASVSVAVLTGYLVVTAWLSVRRPPMRIGWPEYSALCFILLVVVVMLFFGIDAALHVVAPSAFAPYLVFASFTIIVVILDIRMILRGGLAGKQRIARHLWRMCFAWFFAAAFFFIGQQKVMPEWLRGSPILFALAFAPLAIMAVWLVRIRATRISAGALASALLKH